LVLPTYIRLKLGWVLPSILSKRWFFTNFLGWTCGIEEYVQEGSNYEQTQVSEAVGGDEDIQWGE
jgi:hypothetical protein